jgi:Fic family protein
MKWNWQQKDWPKFTYKKENLEKLENDFLYASGLMFGVYKHLKAQDQKNLIVEIISSEALKTSEIEGEILNHNSIQSSIRRNFGFASERNKSSAAEQGISDLMIDLYQNFSGKLTHKTLFLWNKMLISGRGDLKNIGKYRAHEEPIQIVSGRLDKPKIHFEAPPSKVVKKEIDEFIFWFNDSGVSGENPLPPLTRAAIAHLYFVSIHPFEDGNGRIARSLAIKALSQSINQPLLTSFSTIIQDHKKKYYDALEVSNKGNEITKWLIYFAQTFLESQKYTQKLIEFLINKTKFYDALRAQLNQRQEKVLNRIFKKGLNGFDGGLSAQNYISIAKTSKATATRDLQDLLEKKALIKKGDLKGTRYYLNFDELPRLKSAMQQS